MDKQSIVEIVCFAGGICAGGISVWSWLLGMTPSRREAFLDGVSVGLNPLGWHRLWKRK